MNSPRAQRCFNLKVEENIVNQPRQDKALITANSAVCGYEKRSLILNTRNTYGEIRSN